jgi:serine O-acetyltransferase
MFSNNEIKADLYRINGLTGFKGLLTALKNPGFRYIFLFRNLSGAKRYSFKWIFFSYLKRKYTYKYGFQIPNNTKIGKGLYIGHFGTIIINEKVIIGEYCNLAPNITIGETNRGKLKGCPTIGDKVWIGTGSVIVGKITIGSNALIAPNSFVNFDVPNNSIVIGNPAKIIKSDNATKDYICYLLDH